ncbi:MAG: hypothetical protein A3K66_04140 [Euryarchaeota archaeon RBG_16_67_27]|nr:MAG: hypothetical protein A3K66_04140 [Euryarchaeota archaeon RBG_16_67_27]
MDRRGILALAAVTPLFLVMALSFVNVPWPSDPTEIPAYDPVSDQGIANALFDSFPIAVILIALLLGSAMIGGIYLSKMDEPGKVGP